MCEPRWLCRIFFLKKVISPKLLPKSAMRAGKAEILASPHEPSLCSCPAKIELMDELLPNSQKDIL
jgi:hypothetical protein